jgi:hemoglobin-like flavoprotein
MLTPERERLVQETWRKFSPVADEHARYFYDKLYELDPEVRPLFASTDMDEQRHRLMETIGYLVSQIGNTDRFVTDCVALGRRHAGYGVRDSDYDAAGIALLWTLERALGPAFTPEIRDAWTEAYHAMASIMRRVSTVVTGAHRANS